MKAEQTAESESAEYPSSSEDASAWLDEHGDALYRYAKTRVGTRDLAEDLVQETLLAALRSRHRFAGKSSVRTWLLAILRHKIVDVYRREGVAKGQDEAGAQEFFTNDGLWRNALSSWKTAEESLLEDEFRTVLDGCLGELPQALGQVFVLRELDQTEMQELCKIFGLTPGNLRVRLHRARLLLRDCLERRWFGSRPDEAPRRP